MKERLESLVALADSLSGQAKDLIERAGKLAEQEKLFRTQIAAERALPLRVGYMIVRRLRPGVDPKVRLEQVIGFGLSSGDPATARVTVHVRFEEWYHGGCTAEADRFDLGEARFIIVDRKESRERLNWRLSDEAKASKEDEDGE